MRCVRSVQKHMRLVSDHRPNKDEDDDDAWGKNEKQQ